MLKVKMFRGEILIMSVLMKIITHKATGFEQHDIMTSKFASQSARVHESLYSDWITSSMAGVVSVLQCAKQCRGCSAFSYNKDSRVCTQYRVPLCVTLNGTSEDIAYFNKIQQDPAADVCT